MAERLLIIEDDSSTAAALQKVLQGEGYAVDVAGRGDTGLAQARQERYDLVITDLRLPGLNGLELVKELHTAKPKLPIIMMTAHGTTETAIEATKLGAFDYRVKPFEAEDLLAVVAPAVAHARRMSEPVELGEAGSARAALVGRSRAMQNLYKEIGRVASTPATVLIQGETGTGKELVARALYQHGDRADRPFVAVNCAAIPETLLESELFGHERGAFTGAQYRRKGKVEAADGGTLFLDEIGNIDVKTQMDLLRVIETKQFTRVGGSDVVRSDFRIICATNRDLERAVKEGTFREDLYYRLNVFTIELPPLRARRGDIARLAHYFLEKYARAMSKKVTGFTPEAMYALKAYDWPGNVRELENAVERAMVVTNCPMIDREHLPLPAGGGATAEGKRLEDMERRHIEQILKETGWNISRSASVLDIDRVTLYHKIEKYGLKRES